MLWPCVICELRLPWARRRHMTYGLPLFTVQSYQLLKHRMLLCGLGDSHITTHPRTHTLMNKVSHSLLNTHKEPLISVHTHVGLCFYDLETAHSPRWTSTKHYPAVWHVAGSRQVTTVCAAAKTHEWTTTRPLLQTTELQQSYWWCRYTEAAGNQDKSCRVLYSIVMHFKFQNHL